MVQGWKYLQEIAKEMLWDCCFQIRMYKIIINLYSIYYDHNNCIVILISQLLCCVISCLYYNLTILQSYYFRKERGQHYWSPFIKTCNRRTSNSLVRCCHLAAAPAVTATSQSRVNCLIHSVEQSVARYAVSQSIHSLSVLVGAVRLTALDHQ